MEKNFFFVKDLEGGWSTCAIYVWYKYICGFVVQPRYAISGTYSSIYATGGTFWGRSDTFADGGPYDNMAAKIDDNMAGGPQVSIKYSKCWKNWTKSKDQLDH